ncbi:SusC/RagA family TonB-linked outer membrane protein [Paraflavitalea pollutisoli]|uniref:SusC/RagA family TonB-linked outer membrane protein n=1 Tax=Paraflavitalea pollutisoli TaxID=3034143 RepID=UPI0023ED5AA3|nr:SusC/RagA family TonB-linked outer membrane protein [Paraflavitalea sp. H1-2-19X]
MRGLLLSLISLFVSAIAMAQAVSGTVKDEKGAPLEGVTISLRGTKVATQTDYKGHFSIPAPGNGTLELAMIGYTKKIVPIQNRNEINESMQITQSSMDDIVVIGYQKITRKKNTAAISSISGKELANLPAASFDQLLQGRLAGVNVQNFTGEPGASPTVQIRGTTTLSRGYDEYVITNQPLYVVDGIPQPAQDNYTPGMGTGTNFIAGINPQDIESIDVLRDASAAAIYGSRAANGVIMVTTKRGRNTEPRVNLSLYTGFTQRPQLRNTTLGTTERRQKMEMINDLYAQQRLSDGQMIAMPYVLTDSLNPAFNGNTDWQDMFYQVGRINNADLSLSGGAAGGMNYRFSAGYYNEEGIVKATGFTRYTMRLNLMSKALNQKLTINPIIAYSRTQRSRGAGNTVGLNATNMPTSLYNISDSRKDFLLGAYDKNLDENVGSQFTVNLNLGYEFSKHLNFTSQSSYMQNGNRRDYNRTNELTGGAGNISNSFTDQSINLRTSNYLSYNNAFGKHNVALMGGMDVEYNQFKSLFAEGRNGVSDQIQVISGFQQRHLTASSDYQANGLVAYYARLVYDYDSRYMLSAVVRRDGSSRFGKNNKWGTFPSASAAWLLSEEAFMKDSKSNISLLKIRGSVGNAGKAPGQNYLSYNLYRVNAGSYYGAGDATSYNGVSAITPNFTNGVAQPGISWEKSFEWNVGAELEMWNGKFQIMADLYNREGSNILMDVLLPVTTGYDLAKTNSIGVRNAGVEVVLAGSPLKRGSAVNWFSRLNVSYNKNTIMSLPNSGRDLITSNGSFDKTHILSVGRPINTFYMYKTNGVYSTTADIPINPVTGTPVGVPGAYKAGDMSFVDIDGDYLINPFETDMNPDKIPYGDPNPKFTGGWTNNFSYKNFTLGLFFSFVFDRDVINTFDADVFENVSGSGNLADMANISTPDFSKMNIWRKPGDKADYPAYPMSTYRYYYVRGQTFWLEDGDYLRLKSVTAGYDLPTQLIKKWKLGQFKIYGVLDNVFMIQKSKRLPDAEAVDYYGQYAGGGYPIPKKFTLGVQVQF